MGNQQIRDDLMYLAGQLAHRSAQTQDERDAADFISRRMRQHTDDVTLERFFAIENFPYLFAACYAEFIIVGIISIFWPMVAFFYGLLVFVAYLAEFLGIQAISRFFPKYESQNVCAHFRKEEPKKLFLVTAHYDSGCASPLTQPHVVPWLRILHFVVLGAMVILLATCLAAGINPGEEPVFLVQLRWLCVLFLGSCSLGLFYAAARGEDIRGANSNASGVTALLQLAKRFREQPLEHAELRLIATGSHEAWMSGIRNYLHQHQPNKKRTYLLNLESVGAGKLHYLRGEGLLHFSPSNPEMHAAAERLTGDFDVSEAALRAVPTGAHFPLLHGYKAMTLIGLDEDGMPPHWNWVTDMISEVDEAHIEAATDVAEALLRTLDRKT